MMPTLRIPRCLLVVSFAAAGWMLTSAPAQAGDQWSTKADKSVSQKNESLIWDVNRPVKVIRVIVRQGNPIINTVKIMGGEEFTVGARMNQGQKWEIKLAEGTNVGQLRVNVDSAQGSVVGLVLKEGTGKTEGRTAGRVY